MRCGYRNKSSSCWQAFSHDRLGFGASPGGSEGNHLGTWPRCWKTNPGRVLLAAVPGELRSNIPPIPDVRHPADQTDLVGGDSRAGAYQAQAIPTALAEQAQSLSSGWAYRLSCVIWCGSRAPVVG